MVQTRSTNTTVMQVTANFVARLRTGRAVPTHPRAAIGTAQAIAADGAAAQRPVRAVPIRRVARTNGNVQFDWQAIILADGP